MENFNQSIPNFSESSSIPINSNSNRGVKRSHTAIQNGIPNSDVDLISDYLCPICMDLIKEAHLISCGHTFCRECLEKSVESAKRCPKCNYEDFNIGDMFPNHLVDKQVQKYKQELKAKSMAGSKNKKTVIDSLKSFMSKEQSSIDVYDINDMISILEEKKNEMISETEETKYKLLETFLLEIKTRTNMRVQSYTRQLSMISDDLEAVQSHLEDLKVIGQKLPSEKDRFVPKDGSSMSVDDVDDENSLTLDETFIVDGFNVPCSNDSCSKEMTSFEHKKRKIRTNFSELSSNYFHNRREPYFERISRDPPGAPELDRNLDEFSDSIKKFTQFSKVKQLATIDYAGDRFPVVSTASNIASSVEFDKDGDFFAVAGLTKKIRIFDFGNVIKDVVDIHYPCSEMVSDSKVSCISWSPYMKSKMASSDYDGDITIWDAFTTQKIHVFKEHQKRCWSVDFNKMDTKLLASGSDDSCVRLWHLDSERSLTHLPLSANVCCVQFNPESRYHLAFGSADHCVHYYDLRNMKEPLKLFKGHKKAVSYVKFISRNEIVSASTDSQLKVWDVNESSCVSSLRGHVNEKHFVGLATHDDYVACGSENNALYVYYKDFPKKMMSFKFDQKRLPLDTQENKEDDTADFVSAVTWKKNTNILVTGNSLGVIKIVQLV